MRVFAVVYLSVGEVDFVRLAEEYGDGVGADGDDSNIRAEGDAGAKKRHQAVDEDEVTEVAIRC